MRNKNRIMRGSVAGSAVFMVTLSGPLATIDREPRQARKGATVVNQVCAGVWLVRVPTISFSARQPAIIPLSIFSPTLRAQRIFK